MKNISYWILSAFFMIIILGVLGVVSKLLGFSLTTADFAWAMAFSLHVDAIYNIIKGDKDE